MDDIQPLHFLAGTVPAANWPQVIACMNWATENNFMIEQIVNTMVITGPNAIQQPGKQNGVASMFYIFVSCFPDNFKEYFGFEYDESRLAEIPKLIMEIEGKKDNLTP